jgi:ERCC4-related helicase
LRFKKDYKINVISDTFTTQTWIPNTLSADEIREKNYSDWEVMCTKDRIPKMVEIVKKHGKAIIYTEFVSGIVEPIRKAMEDAGFRVGTFTGQTDGKEGLVKKTEQKGVYTNPFQNGDIDVLIASSPIAEGIDGLQKICNTIIFNGVTWTYARYEQIVGRIVRTGQTNEDVYLYHILSRIEDYDFDKRIKVDRMFQKEMLQMCVLDGQIPNIEAWQKGTKDYYKDFVECVLKQQQSRVPTKKQIKDSGVKEPDV